MTFQEQPPVYSVAKNPTPPPINPAMSDPARTVPYPTQSFSPTPYPAYPGYPSMPMPMPGGGGVSASGTANGNNFNPAMRASLVTAAEEKLRRRLEEVYVSNEILRKTGDQMKEGTKRLEAFAKRIADESRAMDDSVKQLNAEIAEYDEKIAKGRNEEEDTNLDECIQPATPLYKQIVNSVAEESALEDTIYYTGEAFRRGKIDLDQFMKNVRDLSRKQFMLRAIIQKCRQKAGLAG